MEQGMTGEYVWGAVLFVAAAGTGVCVYWLQKYVRLVVNLFLGLQIKTPPDHGVIAEGEEVEFESEDGTKLVGVLVKQRGGGKALGTVIFSHEFGGSRHSCMRYADFLLNAGFQIFSFDYRCHGASGCSGEYEPRHWCTDWETADLEAALEAVKGRGDVDAGRIALMGVSRGAVASLCVASKHPEIRAVVSDSGFSTYQTLVDYERKWVLIFTRWTAIHRRVPSVPFTVIARLSLWVSRLRIGVGFPAAEESVGECRMPVLYIHGRRDNYIDWQQARELAERTAGPHQVWVVAKANHNQSRVTEPGKYERTVTQFLTAALEREGVRSGVQAASTA